MFRLGRILLVRCRSLFKVPCTARDVLRQGREIYSTGIQGLINVGRSAENGGDFVKNSLTIAKHV
jgi:hypothetical protein